VNVRFTENVGPSLTVADLVLRNLTTSTDVPATNLRLSYDSATNMLLVTLANGVVLPRGNYRLTLLSAGIVDAQGASLAANAVMTFYLLPGDVNGDRVVNERDLLAVWVDSRKPVQEQDLNSDLTGDGRVTAADVNVVQNNFLDFQ
jgi:YD repeat-containing protein